MTPLDSLDPQVLKREWNKLARRHGEDAAQEAMIRLSKAPTMPHHLTTWLDRAAWGEQCRERNRATKKGTVVLEGVPLDRACEGGSPLDVAVARQEVDRLPARVVAEHLGIVTVKGVV